MINSTFRTPPVVGRRLAVGLRVSVVLVVAVAVAAAGSKLDDALGVFDLRADTQARYSYAEWAHTHPEWSPVGGGVLESARLWMPADATYRIVFGPHFDASQGVDFTRHFLVGYLLPRRPTSSEAEWIVCYGCDGDTLGDGFEELAGVEGGPRFGRMAP